MDRLVSVGEEVLGRKSGKVQLNCKPFKLNVEVIYVKKNATSFDVRAILYK